MQTHKYPTRDVFPVFRIFITRSVAISQEESDNQHPDYRKAVIYPAISGG